MQQEPSMFAPFEVTITQNVLYGEIMKRHLCVSFLFYHLYKRDLYVLISLLLSDYPSALDIA